MTGIHDFLCCAKTWMAGTSRAMTNNLEPFRTPASDAASPHLHGHARVRGADAAGTGSARPRDRGRLYPRAEAGRARHEAASDTGRTGSAAPRHSRADAD